MDLLIQSTQPQEKLQRMLESSSNVANSADRGEMELLVIFQNCMHADITHGWFTI